MTARKKVLLGAAVVLALLVAGGAVFALTRPPEDVSNPNVEFEPEPTTTSVPDEIPEEPAKGPKKVDPLRNFVWATYGYSKDRRKFLPASKLLRPPFWRVWSYTGAVLLEFPPVMAEGKLFLLKNNGALHAIDKRTGRALWKRKLGVLAAASPAYGNGRVFVTILSRGKNKPGAVYALDAKSGKILWKRVLPSAASPRRSSTTTASTSGPRTAASTPSAPVTAPCAGSSRRPARSSPGSRSPTASSTSATTADASTRSADRRRPGLEHRHQGRGVRAALRPLLSTPAVAYGRVYVGSTDGQRCTRSRPPTASSRGPRGPAPTSTPRPPSRSCRG